jgi:hypothetical protein
LQDYQVFVRPFPAGAHGGGRVQVSSVSGQTFTPGNPRRWSGQAIELNGVAYTIDITLNGKSFVASLRPQLSDAKTNLHLTFLVNFLDELKRKLP